jgi:hypothetical protein
LEVIEPLHKNLVYVKSNDVKVPLDQASDILPAKVWKKYCDYQEEYAERILVLRTAKREVPAEANGDKNMPPILQNWTGKINQAQPNKNSIHDTSCAFDSNRIRDYEERNKAFKSKSKLPGSQASREIIPLMVHDIAYLKSFDVEWECLPAALENPSAAADDDDEEELDTSSWCLTDPSTVPIKDLKIPQRGKIPPYLFVAVAIVNTMDPKPRELKTFLEKLLARVAVLKLESGKANATLADAVTREFTEDEWEIYETGIGDLAMNITPPSGDGSAAKGGQHAASTPPRAGGGSAAKVASTARGAAAASTPPRAGGRSAAKGAQAASTPPPAGEAEGAAAKSPTPPTPQRRGVEPPPSPPRRGRPSTAASSAAARAGNTDSDSDVLPPTKAQEPARVGGRKKQQAKVREEPRTTHNDSRERRQTDHFTPPDVTRVVVAKKKRKAASANERMDSSTVGESYTIPVSVQSNRAMAGSLDINKRFPKSYLSSDPSIDAPLPHLTLSGVWHAVSWKYLL